MSEAALSSRPTPGASASRSPLRTAAPQSGFAPWKDPSKTPIVRFENVVKRFGDFVAVKDCTLDIYEREFFALLGPSGCGKTTLLRMLAGFEKPTSGRILVAGQDITELAPYDRPVNMMFQSYALFPHMTVEQNIGFGLKQDGMPKDQMAQRVDETMAMLELGKFGKRKPHQLSGGQQQRVALARAIAKKPRIVLLDEPLGALDKRLRQTAQFELMGIQERTGHDVHHRHARSGRGDDGVVADRGDGPWRVRAGVVAGRYLRGAELALCRELHRRREPVRGQGRQRGRRLRRDRLGSGARPLQGGGSRRLYVANRQVWLALRPEKIHIDLDKPSDASNAVEGKVVDVGYLGSISHYHVELANGQRVKALRTNSSRTVDRPISWEDKVWLQWPPETGIVLTK